MLEYLRGMEGRLLHALRHVAGRVGSETAEYLTIEEVASWTSLSDSHIRRAVRAGDLPASNVGSDSHPTWRIALKDLEGWMERKKGGAPKVPPRSDLNALIKRHLPDL
jgi:excisionase family DNA binding protein